MNIKKLFPEKKFTRKGIMEFLDKKGFYIVLILCIAIVGATAIFVTRINTTLSNSDFDTQKIIPEEFDNKIAANTGVKETAQSAINSKDNAVNSSNPTGSNDSEKLVAVNEDGKSAVNSTGKTNAVNSSKNQKFVTPVFGEVTFEFAQDKLAYSKTLEEWRTHSGIDLSAERGTQVKAVADGVVSDIKNDPRLGITVIIDHQDGTKSVYANLASEDMVAPNQKVKQGDIIGSVGNTAGFESAEQSHLHFEVLKNNEPADPIGFLPPK